MTERVSKSAFNQLFREMQEIRKRVFNGIPADIRREVKEELKELRDEVRKEYQGTRKLVVAILIAILLSFGGIIVESRFSTNSRDSELRSIRNDLQDHVKK